MLRRRRRAAALVMLAVALAAAALVVTGASGGGSTRKPTRAAPLSGVPNPRHRGVAGSRRAESLATVRRLAAHGLPLFCGGRSKRLVALTFDDGPGPYTTLAIKKLRRRHLRATFFLVGKQLRAYPGLARLEKPVAAVGDHTMTHPFLPAVAQDAMRREIADAKTLIARAADQPVALFRPPYGGLSRAISSEARALGLLDVLWNVDSQESLGANYAGIERNVIAGLHPGSIILMHENRGQTIRALPAIFAAIARDHLRAVTVPELVASDPPSLAQLRAGQRGCRARLRAGSGG